MYKRQILRITEKGNIIDSTFEPNYKGCIENKIPVGVYKYSYATTIAQIKNEANVVIKTLNKRKLDYPVFLDIEDKCQENLSDNLMMKMIEAFRAIIVKAGYKFGIYCGYSWYQNQLPEGAKKYDCWVARYPNNDTGELQERLRVPAPTGVIGWQYSCLLYTSICGWCMAMSNIKTGDILNFDYTGTVQTVTLPKGTYKLECWGAEG